MDPRTGLSWLREGSELGQFQFRPARQSQFRRFGSQRASSFQRFSRAFPLSDYDAFAVQVYELRPSFRYSFGGSGEQQWVNIKNEAVVTTLEHMRSLFFSFCDDLRRVQLRYRTISKMFGRQRSTGQWEVLAECDVPRR